MMSTPKTNIIPDRSRPISRTTASSIGSHQGGSFEKLATGEDPRVKLETAKQEVTLGTWNVRTLHGNGKLNELEHEMQRYKWNVLGTAEVRWWNTGEMITEEQHKVGGVV